MVYKSSQQIAASGTSPITYNASGAIGINNAAADGATKGAATFTAADFNDNGSGLISIDYANGQAASGSVKGFLTSADWTTFNAKVATSRTISTTAPLTGGGDLSADRTFAITAANLAGTANQVTLSASGTGVLLGSSNITLSLPQDIASGSTPTFLNLSLTDSANSTVAFGPGGFLTSTQNYQFVVSGGAKTVASAWTATFTTASLMECNDGFNFYVNTGLTIGNTFTPTRIFRMDDAGNLLLKNAAPNTPRLIECGNKVANNPLILSLYNDNTFMSGIGMSAVDIGLRLAGDNVSTANSLADIGYYNSGGTSTWNSKFKVIGTGNITAQGKFTTYNGVATAGWGTPAIYGANRSTGQTGAVASVATYTVGAADGSFYVSANVNVTAYTAGSINVQCSYTDETNTARTLTFTFSNLTGTLLNAINATGPYEGIPVHIRCKASTAITILTTVTVFTGTYNVEGIISQLQ